MGAAGSRERNGLVAATGCKRGRVCPGRIWIDFPAEALMGQELINAHPLVNTATTAIGREDLLHYVQSTGHAPLVLKL